MCGPAMWTVTDSLPVFRPVDGKVRTTKTSTGLTSKVWGQMSHNCLAPLNANEAVDLAAVFYDQ